MSQFNYIRIVTQQVVVYFHGMIILENDEDCNERCLARKSGYKGKYLI